MLRKPAGAGCFSWSWTKEYVLQRNDQYMALADCPQHGLAFVKLAFGKNDEGKRIMTRSSSLADEQSPAYVHTKHLQWAQKVAAQEEKE